MHAIRVDDKFGGVFYDSNINFYPSHMKFCGKLCNPPRKNFAVFDRVFIWLTQYIEII